jgi:hypothetical protein
MNPTTSGMIIVNILKWKLKIGPRIVLNINEGNREKRRQIGVDGDGLKGSMNEMLYG